MASLHSIRIPNVEDRKQAIMLFLDVPATRLILPGHDMVVTDDHITALSGPAFPSSTSPRLMPMAPPKRPFNPDALKQHALPQLMPQIGVDTVAVWRYTVLVPMEEYRADGQRLEVATAADLDALEGMLADHFGGITAPAAVPALKGAGARDPLRPGASREFNRHASFTIYAAARGASDEYFRALRRELEDALAEGVILIERQDVTIL